MPKSIPSAAHEKAGRKTCQHVYFVALCSGRRREGKKKYNSISSSLLSTQTGRKRCGISLRSSAHEVGFPVHEAITRPLYKKWKGGVTGDGLWKSRTDPKRSALETVAMAKNGKASQTYASSATTMLRHRQRYNGNNATIRRPGASSFGDSGHHKVKLRCMAPFNRSHRLPAFFTKNARGTDLPFCCYPT